MGLFDAYRLGVNGYHDKCFEVNRPKGYDCYLFGISCGADIINGRIETAKTLLADTCLTVTEIGEKCGYNSSVHFSGQFRQLVGLSPTEYRNKF